MKEGTAINKSLLTLGNVINKLSEGAQAQGKVLSNIQPSSIINALKCMQLP
jgi:uncharacterized protein YejL (UPF0352 family)